MPCDYVSVIRVGMTITNRKALEKTLKHFGLDTALNVQESEDRTVISGPDFRMILQQGKDAVLEYSGNDANFAKNFKQRYGVEAAKVNLRKQGFFITEKKVGNEIKLEMRR